ncbi:MAG: penicillin acylase family protein, partial [Anaerolineales bacterium]|nr:penicillin acylase family protein [Anaerolineales bacterium]
MSRSAKIFLTVVLLLLIPTLFIFMVSWATLSAPHPTQQGTLQLPGLQDEVRVLRDRYGVAHIYAQNEHDLFMAQGYVHAQDRFWQMEFWRYTGQGRLSEIIGEAGVDSDRFIRTAGWNRVGEATVDYYRTEAPDFYEILELYSAGVNAYLAENGNNTSINQTILTAVNGPREIEPWTPLNTVTWGVVMAHDLGGNYSTELRRARLLEAVGPELVEQLMPPYPYDRRPVIAPTDLLAPMPGGTTAVNPSAINWRNVNLDLVGATPPNGFALGTSDFAGSNNWVIGGAHTASGLPLLADDPHLGIQMPSIWYQVGLHAPGFNVTGFSFAGVPGVIVGYNDRIAWGVTNVGPDTQDLFIEKINPANPNQYEFQGEWRDMEIIEEVIKVSGGEDIVLPVRFTHHGPILSDEVDAGDQVLAFQWTSHQPSPLLQSVILLNRAQNFEEFVSALRYWDAAGQNIVYADVDGNIGYQATGVVPVRRNGDGTVPVPGWTGEYEWVGTIPYEEMPRLYNPPAGYIVTANNAVVDEDYPHFIDRDWADGDRAQRIETMVADLIAEKGQLTA